MNKAGILIISLAAFFLVGIYWALKPNTQNHLPYFQYNTASASVEKYTEAFKDLHKVTFINAIDQNYKPYNADSIKDKIVVADYFFVSCPGICKQMGEQMKRLNKQNVKNADVVLVSLTSKPNEDSVPVLKEYAKRMQVSNDASWKFLLSTEKKLYDFAKNELGILNKEDSEEDFVHTERFVLLDKNKYIRGYYDGTSATDVDRLMKDIEVLKKEKNNADE